MVLTRPTLIQVPAFDATQQFTFTFAIQGITAQVVANQLTIRNQDTNNIVYQEKQETFKYEHIVNANELTNGTYYNATISVFDNDGNESPASIPIQFWCYSTPLISFTNLPTSNIINNASFDFQFAYTQSEGELLNSYIVNIYNNSGSLISTSGAQYVTNGTPPYSGNYLVTGLENATAYLIEINATTINNTTITTGQIPITVQYVRPDLFTMVELTNNCDEGYITINSNMVLIEGESNPDPPTYIDDKEVDLTEDGSWVQWNEGYSINGNYLARIWFRNPNPYSQILQFSNTNGQTVTLHYMQGYENVESENLQSYMELHVTSISGMQYYIYSNFIDILEPEQQYNIWLTCENNIYQLQLAAVT